MKRRILDRSGWPRMTRSGAPAELIVQAEADDELQMLHVAVVFDDEAKTYTTDIYPVMGFDFSPDTKTLMPLSLLTHLRYNEEEENVFMCIRDQRGMYRWRSFGDGHKDSTFETIADFVKFLEQNEFVEGTGYESAALR